MTDYFLVRYFISKYIQWCLYIVLSLQMGFADMSAMDAMIYGDVENDEDLEAELLALQGESSPERTTRKKGRHANALHGPPLL